MGAFMPKMMQLPFQAFHFGSRDVSVENRTCLTFRRPLQFMVVSPKQLFDARICVPFCAWAMNVNLVNEIKAANGSNK